MTILSIPAQEGQPLPDPPTTGNWLRQPDGSLLPEDEATARDAGLWQDETQPE